MTELPTVPSSTEQLIKEVREVVAKLSHLPIDQIAGHLNSAIQGIDELVHSPELVQTMAALQVSSLEIQAFTTQLNHDFPHLATEFEATLNSAHGLMRSMDRQVQPLSDTLKIALQHTDSLVKDTNAQLILLMRSATATLEQARSTLGELKGIAVGANPLGYQLSQMLTELAAAAHSLKNLTGYLERHPDALLKGKGGGRYR